MIKLPRLFTTLVAMVLLLSSTIAQSESNRVVNYIQQYRDLAIAEMLRTGIPASITLAQGILETAGGQSDLASLANNHFGIKCKSEWTGDRMFHDDDAKGECFRKYGSVEESYRDHSEFLRTRPNYAFLFKLDPTDYEGWAKGLKKAGYATNPAYPQRLMKIIVENNLQQYTLLALQQQQNKEQELFLTEKSSSTKEKYTAVTYTQDVVKEAPMTMLAVKQEVASKEEKIANAATYSFNQVFIINDVKVIYAQAGTSLLALANNYNVTLKRLIEFNEISEDDIIKRDQLIFLEKKSKRGAKDIHIVAVNENLHDIAQKEGVQLQSLLEYNKLQRGMEPAAGEKIYLKAPSPSSPRVASASLSVPQVSTK
jgi:LysM repeat protein